MHGCCLRFAFIACLFSIAIARLYTRSELAATHLAAYVHKADGSARNIRPTPEAYNAERSTFFRYEESKGLGADIELNARELLANQIIMTAKTYEYEEGLVTPHLFKPSKHFFSVLEEISKTPLFSYLQLMPKGGVLHAHDTAVCSTDFLIELTYRENLWACEGSGALEAVSMRFAKSKPSLVINDTDCTWTLLAEMRARYSAAAVDEYLRERFTLYPKEKFLDNNEAWQSFMQIFGLLDGLLTYAPVWADYYYNALKEFRADGVQYLEFRSTLPKLYDLEDGNYTEMDTVRIYKETLDKFMADYPDFIGSKMIYAPLRNASPETVEKYISTCIEIKVSAIFFDILILCKTHITSRPYIRTLSLVSIWLAKKNSAVHSKISYHNYSACRPILISTSTPARPTGMALLLMRISLMLYYSAPSALGMVLLSPNIHSFCRR
ncbi:unnamed protein product [Ceratitis capitata]|uniref:adenosine deaminase n=1 Tax=Ceratitis capitata TaxID=7213 RepID=A0A811UYS0_CERCA|nr:unnamed protein product [Ceratitis capitata]